MVKGIPLDFEVLGSWRHYEFLGNWRPELGNGEVLGVRGKDPVTLSRHHASKLKELKPRL